MRGTPFPHGVYRSHKELDCRILGLLLSAQSLFCHTWKATQNHSLQTRKEVKLMEISPTSSFFRGLCCFPSLFYLPPLKHGFHSHFPCFGSILFLPFFPPALPLHYSFYSRTPTSKLGEQIQLMKPGVWALHSPSNSQQLEAFIAIIRRRIIFSK